MSLNILVPTDFSPTAEKAFLYALDIASRCSGTVFLHHIHTPIESAFIETVEVRTAYNLRNEIALMNDLHLLRDKWSSQYPLVKIVVALGRSPLVGSILRFIQEHHIDLIVMGTQGASGLKKVIVGTIAARMVEKSSVPLLLVPEQFEWSVPEKMVLATNFHHADTAAIAISGKVAKLYGAFIELVHLPDTGADRVVARAVIDEYVDYLREEFPDLPLTATIVPAESVTDTLEDLHKHVPYDMLVMVRHQKIFLEHLFWKSNTKHMAYLTTKPLLVVPSPEN